MNKKKLIDELTRSVLLVYAISLPANEINYIPGIMVQPANISQLFVLMPDGTQARKARLTHDLSFSLIDNNLSIDNRIDLSKYPELIYEWCLQRVIHFIVALRINHPKKAIFIVKYDFSDAYRRIARALSASKQSIFIPKNIDYMFL